MISESSRLADGMRKRMSRLWIEFINRLANAHTEAGPDNDFSGPTLRGRVMMVVLSTTCVALLLSAAALLIYEIRAYRLSRLHDMQTQADIIARATAPALAFNDVAVANENLHMLQLRPQITAAAVYRNNGDLFASYLPATLAADDFPRWSQKEGPVFSGDKLELFHPIRQNGELLGTLYLKTDNDIVGRLFDYLAILVGVMIASLATAALVTVRLQRAVTDPILNVAKVARHVMTHRDFSMRAPKTSSDEVGQLVDAFNDMLGEVGARTAELERANLHLNVEMAERRKAEEALRNAAKKKDEFLATLAHELRNPLAPISNAAEILRRADDSNPTLRGRALDIMARQVKQMVRLIDDLLDVSRITTGKLLLQCEKTDLVEVLRHALEIASPSLEMRRHVVDVRLPQHPVYIHGDGIRLAQVFANLLNNAAKYTPEGGLVCVTLTQGHDDVRVAIQDNGIGIAPALQEAVFEMFVQVDQSLDRGRAGLGIGLTLAQQLVHLHGGEIQVRSEGENRGSEFTVRLPLHASEAAPEEVPAASPPPPQRPQSLKVLIADDNVDFATSLGQLLESLGHSVVLAHDGQRALEVAMDFQPELAFLDIGMPGLNGYEVATRLKFHEKTGHATLVAITGWSQEKDRLKSEKAGFKGHLVKPVELGQLLPIIDDMKRCA